MAASDRAAPRPSELAALVRAAQSGKHQPVYLFIGEPFETRTAVQQLLDVLVPESRRAFNLETYDGRTTPIATILDSLRMRGFFTGVKVVWVREPTLFLSGEKRGDLTAALLAAWSEGRQLDAAEKLLTLVALAGWSQEQFSSVRWSGATKTRVREVFGDDLDAEQLAVLDAAQAACVARDLTVSAYRDDSSALLEFLDAGLPPDSALVFSAAAVDARKRVVKRLREIGAVVDCGVSRERSGALSRDTVDDLIRRIVAQFDKRLAPGAHELIARRAGPETALLAMELEKLCLYVGDRASITEEDVRVMVRDMAESWIFDFTSALAARQLVRGLPLLRGLFEQGEPPLRVLAMIAREVRLLLIARECLDGALRGHWRPDVQFNAFQSQVLPRVDAATLEAFGKAHPFVLFRRFQDAARLRTAALRTALRTLADLDARLKSSRGDPALLLEAFVIEWCGRGATPERRARVA